MRITDAARSPLQRITAVIHAASAASLLLGVLLLALRWGGAADGWPWQWVLVPFIAYLLGALSLSLAPAVAVKIAIWQVRAEHRRLSRRRPSL